MWWGARNGHEKRWPPKQEEWLSHAPEGKDELLSACIDSHWLLTAVLPSLDGCGAPPRVQLAPTARDGRLRAAARVPCHPLTPGPRSFAAACVARERCGGAGGLGWMCGLRGRQQRIDSGRAEEGPLTMPRTPWNEWLRAGLGGSLLGYTNERRGPG